MQRCWTTPNHGQSADAAQMFKDTWNKALSVSIGSGGNCRSSRLKPMISLNRVPNHWVGSGAWQSLTFNPPGWDGSGGSSSKMMHTQNEPKQFKEKNVRHCCVFFFLVITHLSWARSSLLFTGNRHRNAHQNRRQHWLNGTKTEMSQSAQKKSATPPNCDKWKTTSSNCALHKMAAPQRSQDACSTR